MRNISGTGKDTLLFFEIITLLMNNDNVKINNFRKQFIQYFLE